MSDVEYIKQLADRKSFKELMKKDFFIDLNAFCNKKSHEQIDDFSELYLSTTAMMNNSNNINKLVDLFLSNKEEKLLTALFNKINHVIFKETNEYSNLYVYQGRNRTDNVKIAKRLFEASKKNTWLNNHFKNSNINYNLLFCKNKGGDNLDMEISIIEEYFYFLKEKKCDLYEGLFEYLDFRKGFEGNKKQVNVLIQLMYLYDNEKIIDKIFDLIPKVLMLDSNLSGVKLDELKKFLENKSLTETNQKVYDKLFGDVDFVSGKTNLISLSLDLVKLKKMLNDMPVDFFIRKLNNFFIDNNISKNILEFISNEEKIQRYNFISKDKENISVITDLLNNFEFKVMPNTEEESLSIIKDFFKEIVKDLNYNNFDTRLKECSLVFKTKDTLDVLKTGKSKRTVI